MNWEIIGFLLFAFFLVLILGFILILYIRHWQRREGQQYHINQKHEGVYFSRYLPKFLRVFSDKPETVEVRKSYWHHIFNFLVISTIIGIFTALIYQNKYKLIQPIELTASDIRLLNKTSYSWEKEDSQILPSLSQELEDFVHDGVIILSDQDDNDWVTNGKNYHFIAKEKWVRFFQEKAIEVVDCDWKKVERCQRKANNHLYLVLPGMWHQDKIQTLLDEGNTLLFYGFPRQIYEAGNSEYAMDQLVFQRKSDSGTREKLALVGDKELTLGFDAGLIFKVQPSFPIFTAKSDSPQAVSISELQVIGSSSSTRLYAKSNKQGGRLIWMDFSPNKDDHSVEINQKNFDALIASIFRYINRKSYSSIATWPAGLSLAALIEEDTEDQFKNARRVANYFKQKQYPITWYILSNNAQNHRDITKLLAETGEVACHGDNHQVFTLSDLEQQHIRLARCKKVLEELTGEQVVSFRPPEEKHNDLTLSALANVGMQHYIANTATDRFVPIYYKDLSGEKTLLSIPRMNSDDYLLWDNYETNEADSINILYKEVDQIEKLGGLFMFSFHTQFMNDDGHFNTITKLADYIDTKPAYFATASEIADWWLARKKLLNNQPISAVDYQRFHPRRLQVDKTGELHSTVFAEAAIPEETNPNSVYDSKLTSRE